MKPSRSCETDDDKVRYLPLGQRPGPYPPGYGSAAEGCTGNRLVRVVVTSQEKDHGLPMADPARLPERRRTARNVKTFRSLHTDELPVGGRMTLAEAVSDDPGWLAIHGERIQGSFTASMPTTGPDRWRGPRRRRAELPIGGVLVSRAGARSTEPKHWKIWRVLPGGPACALEATLDDQPNGSEREAIAKALDRDVEVAFTEAAERIESTQGAQQAKRVRAAIEAWKQDEPRPKRHRRH